MERKIFHKAKLATAIALVSTTTLLTGCIVDGDRSFASTTTVEEDASRISITDQATPLAQILGLVQDTNGNPVVGARVSVGGAAATTDSNGAYAISNVPVTGFTGSTGAATPTALQVSIVPAAGYLSATVSVTPQASTIVQTIDGASGNTEDALLAIVTTDGLAVSAGITVVPALQSTVTGILRNAENGLPVDGAVIGLELLGVNTVAQQQVQNAGAGTSYGVASYQAATDASGTFTFTNLPVDAEYDLAIEGWTFNAQTGGVTGATAMAGAKFSTTPEVANQNIGTITADLITSSDGIAPFVTSVNGVVVNNTTGVLNDDLDGTQGLTINFSEPLQQIVDANSIYVYNTTLNAVIAVDSFALSADGTSLTITSTNPIAQDQTFEIYLSVVDFQDIAGNAIAESDNTTNATFQGETNPKYDLAAGVTSVGTVKLTLKTFADPVTQAGAVIGLAQLLSDGGTGNFDILQTLNSTFADIDTGTVRSDDLGIEQLNEGEAAARLTAAALTTYSEPGFDPADAPAVATDVARIQFTIDPALTQSDQYLIELRSEAGTAKNFSVVANAVVGTVVGNATDEVTLTLTDGFSGLAALLLDGVEPNDTVSISSLTSFGTIDGVTSIVLTDQVAPTTVLQSSYGQGLKTDAIVGVNYGNGGELADITTATVGTPIINITPRLLTPQVGESIPLPVASTWLAVQDLMQDGNNTIAGPGSTSDGDIDVSLTGIATGYTAYDERGFSNWSVGDRKIGIAVSENVSLTATDPTDTATQVLSGWTAQNNAIKNDLNATITSVDLINVTVPDVIDFANIDNGKVIDFTNAIVDGSGNTAATANNAMVVVRDLMPPMLTTAVYTGEKIILTYNENVEVPVTAPNAAIFSLDSAAGADLPIIASETNTSVTGNTVTIDRAGFPNLDSEVVFDRGTFDHDDNISTVDAAHSVVISEDVQDENGTSWANWDGGVGLVDIPGIAIRDDAGDFQIGTPTVVNLSATSNRVTYRFTHRIDLSGSSLGVEATENELAGSEIVSRFAISAGALDPSSTATLDPTGRVLVIDFVVTPASGTIVGSDITLGGAFTVRSEWDNNDVLTDAAGFPSVTGI